MKPVFFGFILLSAVGCGPGDGPRAVSGRVTFRGAPLDGGGIEFHPAEGSSGPIAGCAVRAGTFDIPSDQGLPPGRYRVAVRYLVSERSTDPLAPTPMSREQIHPRFNDESTLIVEVPPNRGACAFDFAVE